MADHSKIQRVSSTHLIVAGLLLGLAAGLFFGDYTADLKLVGDAYVGMLQMTVLPYILFSLIANIGRLNKSQARVLARIGMLTLLGLWLLAGLMMLVMALSLPAIPSGSFFSVSLIQSAPAVDFLELFIPSNLFRSLSNNAVPAVVLFCLLFGVALMGIDKKATLLAQIDVVVETLQKVSALVLKLTPLGVFAIVASAAGTISLQDFGRLQAYILAMSIGALLLALLAYPMLIAVCTPIRGRRVVAVSRDAIITAFVLGSIFAVIPMLVHTVNRLFSEIDEPDRPGESNMPSLMLPLAYPFPDSGKVLTLLFVPFSAWFYGNPLPVSDYGILLTTGVVVLFGKVVNAIPFLLEIFEIPADIFQLFLASGILMGRIADIAAVMHLITFTVITTAVVKGCFAWHWAKLALNSLWLVLAVTLVGVAMHSLLLYSYAGRNTKSDAVLDMQLLEKSVPITVLRESSPNPVPLTAAQGFAERMAQRGVLRVGFSPDHLPFSFFNGAGDLVGFDVALLQELAVDLEVALEFVPYDLANLAAELDADHFDIAISGITATAKRSTLTMFSEPYLYVNMAMVVADHRKSDFSGERSIRALPNFRIGAKQGSYFISRAREHFPNVDIVPLASERDFFVNPGLDALLTTAEGGSAWTLLYPGYTTVKPVVRAESAPLVFAIPANMEIEEFLEMWIQLKRLDGTIDKLFDYWILGRTDPEYEHRWSIIRDVLHWVE